MTSAQGTVRVFGRRQKARETDEPYFPQIYVRLEKAQETVRVDPGTMVGGLPRCNTHIATLNKGALVQLGDLPVYGVRHTSGGGYSWYSTLVEAYHELRTATDYYVKSYQRDCAGKRGASQLQKLILDNPMEDGPEPNPSNILV